MNQLKKSSPAKTFAYVKLQANAYVLKVASEVNVTAPI